MNRRLIEDYAPIGDMRTAALICRDGSMDWLCLPRFDSAAGFAGLLGTPEHGQWKVGPAIAPGMRAPYADRRHYLGDSAILVSEWDTPGGTVRVTDFMPEHPGHTSRVIRIVEGVSGNVEMVSDLCPRFGYGRYLPWIHDDGHLMVLESGPDALWLAASAKCVEKEGALVGRFTVESGERHVFVLSWGASHGPAPSFADHDALLEGTVEFWRAWVEQCAYQGPYREAVVRALITLKLMTHSPTGGIVAALTTSLPEEIGGVRNWDYRYTWLRDAAFTLAALLNAGSSEEMEAWRGWLLRAVGGDPENLQIMYGLAGERELAERELDWLPGYEGSGPVRIGNAAAGQLQLDVYGEVVETLYLAHERGVARCKDTEALHLRLIDQLATLWREPDDGIWEVRGGRRHFTHSKIMCWVAVDRTVRLVEAGVLEADLEALIALREEIHAEVCAKGYDPVRNTFTQSYGSRELDASLLLLPRSGFLPADDPRVIGTVDAIRRELGAGGALVHRYPTAGQDAGVDGLKGDEGAFLLCSFWLVDALALTGRLAEAKELFEELLALRSDQGLLAEEYDPVAKRQLGNCPQAFSMLGVVQSAFLIDQLERAEARAAAA
ncbi:glycoside hydrolase family 15 protein [Streptomyces sp. NPDC048717]|uniref:glycoside hydrolase family 15 protein n=1 Tax=Streptomyces sp. NPDC048717 TaxID=3154928 RepID=UPI00341D8643